MGITNENYYEPNGYMSTSTFKQFRDCEHCGLAMFNGKFKLKQTKPMMVGSYVDAWCEGTLSNFKETHPDLFKKDGTLKADYIKADEIIERIKNDAMFIDYITGEKQVILTGEIGGIKWKGKADIITDERIVDMKIMRSCERIMGKSLVDHWGYDIQGAIYQELEYQRTGIRKKFYLAIATKEETADLEIVEIEQFKLDNALELVKKLLPRIIEIIRGEINPLRCNRCEYCRETKKITKPLLSDYLGLSELDIKIINGEEI